MTAEEFVTAVRLQAHVSVKARAWPDAEVSQSECTSFHWFVMCFYTYFHQWRPEALSFLFFFPPLFILANTPFMWCPPRNEAGHKLNCNYINEVIRSSKMLSLLALYYYYFILFFFHSICNRCCGIIHINSCVSFKFKTELTKCSSRSCLTLMLLRRLRLKIFAGLTTRHFGQLQNLSFYISFPSALRLMRGNSSRFSDMPSNLSQTSCLNVKK